MKKLFLVLLVFIMAIGIFSCSKEEQIAPTTTISPVKKSMTETEFAFLENLQRSIASTNNHQQWRSDETANESNPFDYLGARNVDAMKFAIAIEKQRPAGTNPDFSRFSSNVQAYLTTNPVIGNVQVEFSSEFQVALQNLLKLAFCQSNPSEAKVDIKIIEEAILNSGVITEAQKTIHLIFAASLRHMKGFVASEDIYIGDSPIPNALPTWEQLYANCLNEALYSWEEAPVATALAWADLPYTMAACAADATWIIATR